VSFGTNWGTTAAERRLTFPCDGLISQVNASYFRGITIGSAPETVFRWLCQLRVSSYSYFGPRGPQTLPAGPDDIAPGQTAMHIFEVADYESGRHLTLRLVFKTRESRLYARVIRDLAVAYVIVAQERGVRLLTKVIVHYQRGPLAAVARLVVPWMDAVMTRKQLMTLKRLAEAGAAFTP
jgi:hypothetical protein